MTYDEGNRRMTRRETAAAATRRNSDEIVALS